MASFISGYNITPPMLNYIDILIRRLARIVPVRSSVHNHTEYHIQKTLETSTLVFAELEKNTIAPTPFR